MKSALLFLTLALTQTALRAQAPQAFNYQAVLRDSDGTPIKSQTLALKISIIHGYTDGPPEYLETHNTQTNEFGIANVAIGLGVTTDDFSSIDWANGPYALYAASAEVITPESVSISDTTHGGLVFHVNSAGTHGLVKDLVNLHYARANAKNPTHTGGELSTTTNGISIDFTNGRSTLRHIDSSRLRARAIRSF